MRQIAGFTANSEYGYLLMLYDEYFGVPCGAPETYNGTMH